MPPPGDRRDVPFRPDLRVPHVGLREREPPAWAQECERVAQAESDVEVMKDADTDDRVVSPCRDPLGCLDVADDDRSNGAESLASDRSSRLAQLDRDELTAGVGEQRGERAGPATELETDDPGSEPSRRNEHRPTARGAPRPRGSGPAPGVFVTRADQLSLTTLCLVAQLRVAHTVPREKIAALNFHRAKNVIRSSSRPCRQRLMFVVPYARGW